MGALVSPQGSRARPPSPPARHGHPAQRLFQAGLFGIALLIMGSFVPWLYYSFCYQPQRSYLPLHRASWASPPSLWRSGTRFAHASTGRQSRWVAEQAPVGV